MRITNSRLSGTAKLGAETLTVCGALQYSHDWRASVQPYEVLAQKLHSSEDLYIDTHKMGT